MPLVTDSPESLVERSERDDQDTAAAITSFVPQGQAGRQLLSYSTD